MKTRNTSRRRLSGLSNTIDVSKKSQMKPETNRSSNVSISSDDSSDENVSFRRRSKKLRLQSDSSELSASDNEIPNERLTANSSEENHDPEMASSSPKRKIRQKSNRKRLLRKVTNSSSESEANISHSRSSSCSSEPNHNRSEKRTKMSKRIRFLKGTQNSSDDSEEIDVSGLLKYKYKKLKYAVCYNNTKEVGDIIADKFVKLDSPEFGELLWRALDNKNPKIISMLVNAGVDVNTPRCHEAQDNILIHAVASKPASEEYDKLALLLIEHDEVDIEELDGGGNSLLHRAVEGGSLTIIKKLLELGVDVDAVNYESESVMGVASMSPLMEQILPMLVKYNSPDKETKNRRALEAMGYILRGNSNLTAMRALLDLDVPINERDDRGWSLLDYAMRHDINRPRPYDVIELLLKYGADPKRRRSDGLSPLYVASTYKISTIAALLIKYGASVHSRSNNGLYPLHAACTYSSVPCIGLLLFLGAKVNYTDNRGLTAYCLMHTHYLNDANKIMIRHMALAISKNERVKRADLLQISNIPSTGEYFVKCLDELNNMRTFKLYNYITAFDILAKGVQGMTQLIRNEDFVKCYYKNQAYIMCTFPMYSSTMQKLFSVALKMRKNMKCEIEALDKATYYVLPEEIWEMIAFHSSCNRLPEFYV